MKRWFMLDENVIVVRYTNNDRQDVLYKHYTLKLFYCIILYLSCHVTYSLWNNHDNEELSGDIVTV